MVTLEQVSKLRDYADITFEEAKDILEKTNGDVLEAVLELEKQGKINRAENDGKFTMNSEKEEAKEIHENKKGFKEFSKDFTEWFKKMISIGNRNAFVIEKHGNVELKIPVTIL